LQDETGTSRLVVAKLIHFAQEGLLQLTDTPFERPWDGDTEPQADACRKDGGCTR
jgi:hypothetical protein